MASIVGKTEAPSVIELYGSIVDADYDEIFDAQLPFLWRIFISITTVSNPKNPNIMRRRDLELTANKLGLTYNRERIEVIFSSEKSRGPAKQFCFTSFLRALYTIICDIGVELPNFSQNETIQLLGSREHSFINVAERGFEEVASYLTSFNVALRCIFSYFSSQPSTSEIAFGRHPRRPDVNRMRQSMDYGGWLTFAAGFELSTGLGLSLTDIGQIFFSAIRREACDDVGGLSFEEFEEALLRVAWRASVNGDSTSLPEALDDLMSFLADSSRSVSRLLNAGWTPQLASAAKNTLERNYGVVGTRRLPCLLCLDL